MCIETHACLSVHSGVGGGDINGLPSAFSTVFVEVGALPEPKPNNSAILASQLAREMPCLCHLCGGTAWLLYQPRPVLQWVLETAAHTLVKQTFYPWCCFPSP